MKTKSIIALLLFGVSLICMTAKSQTVTFDMHTYNNGKYPIVDTVTNTGTAYDSITVFGKYSYIAIQPVVTKISGTLLHTTTPILQGSIDGLNWQTVDPGDTLHIVNQAVNTTIWNVSAATGNPYAFFRVYWQGAGTMSATLKAKVLFKQ